MSGLSLVVVGNGPILALAVAIACKTRGEDVVRVVELPADQIGLTELDFLKYDDPASTRVFAAVGLHALNYARFDLWAKLRIKGYRPETLVHPTADVDSTALVGEQCLIGPFASIGPNAQVGRGTILVGRNSIAVRARVGSFVWMATNACVGMDGSIGSHVVLGEGVAVGDATSIGDNSEIAVPGAYRTSVNGGTFISREFDEPARIVGLA